MATVLITGTSTGIGFATALAFGRAGYTVAAAMRNSTRTPALANVAARDNLAITVFTMDVDADASVSEAIGRIGKEIGPFPLSPPASNGRLVHHVAQAPGAAVSGGREGARDRG